jgi:hypothetical protein
VHQEQMQNQQLMLVQSLLLSPQYQFPMKHNILNVYQIAVLVMKPLMKKTSTLAEKECSQSMEQSPLEKQLDGMS